MGAAGDVEGRDGVRDAYDTVADSYAAHFPDTRAEAPLDLALLDAFADAVRRPDGPGRVLDAGCGTGRMSRYLTRRGCAVEGVDLSPRMVEVARRLHPDLPFSVAPLTDLPAADGQLDGVLLWYATIHTPPASQGRVLAEVARALRPGGHVLLALQAGRGVRDVAPAWRHLGHQVELVRYLSTADEVVSRLEAVGLGEECRLVRRPRGPERDDQAVVLARARG